MLDGLNLTVKKGEVQYVTYINPLRNVLVIIRGVFLKGNGMDVLRPQMATPAVLGALLIGISSLRFKKTIG